MNSNQISTNPHRPKMIDMRLINPLLCSAPSTNNTSANNTSDLSLFNGYNTQSLNTNTALSNTEITFLNYHFFFNANGAWSRFEKDANFRIICTSVARHYTSRSINPINHTNVFYVRIESYLNNLYMGFDLTRHPNPEELIYALDFMHHPKFTQYLTQTILLQLFQSNTPKLSTYIYLINCVAKTPLQSNDLHIIYQSKDPILLSYALLCFVLANTSCFEENRTAILNHRSPIELINALGVYKSTCLSWRASKDVLSQNIHRLLHCESPIQVAKILTSFINNGLNPDAYWHLIVKHTQLSRLSSALSSLLKYSYFTKPAYIHFICNHPLPELATAELYKIHRRSTSKSQKPIIDQCAAATFDPSPIIDEPHDKIHPCLEHYVKGSSSDHKNSYDYYAKNAGIIDDYFNHSLFCYEILFSFTQPNGIYFAHQNYRLAYWKKNIELMPNKIYLIESESNNIEFFVLSYGGIQRYTLFLTGQLSPSINIPEMKEKVIPLTHEEEQTLISTLSHNTSVFLHREDMVYVYLEGDENLKYTKYDRLTHSVIHRSLELRNIDQQRIQNALKAHRKPGAMEIHAINAAICKNDTVYDLKLTPPPYDLTHIRHNTIFLYYEDINDRIIVRFTQHNAINQSFTLSQEYPLNLDDQEKNELFNARCNRDYFLDDLTHGSILEKISNKTGIRPTHSYACPQWIKNKYSAIIPYTMCDHFFALKSHQLLTSTHIVKLHNRSINVDEVIRINRFLTNIPDAYKNGLETALLNAEPHYRNNWFKRLTTLFQHFNVRKNDLLNEEVSAFIHFYNYTLPTLDLLNIMSEFNFFSIAQLNLLMTAYTDPHSIILFLSIASKLKDYNLLQNNWNNLFTGNTCKFILLSNQIHLSRIPAHLFNQNTFNTIVARVLPDDDAETVTRINQYIMALINPAANNIHYHDNHIDHQSTHTTSVHLSVTQSLTQLDQRYSLSNDEKIDHLFNDFFAFKKKIPSFTLVDNSVRSAAARCIDRLQKINYAKEDQTGFSLKKIIALIWSAAMDTSCHLNKDINVQELLVIHLRNIQREYNINDQEKDKPSCASGTINSLVNTLNGIHPDVVIILIGKTAITEKTRSIFKKTFLELLEDCSDAFIVQIRAEYQVDNDWENKAVEEWYNNAVLTAKTNLKQAFNHDMTVAKFTNDQIKQENQRIHAIIEAEFPYYIADKCMLNLVDELPQHNNKRRKIDDDLQSKEVVASSSSTLSLMSMFSSSSNNQDGHKGVRSHSTTTSLDLK